MSFAAPTRVRTLLGSIAAVVLGALLATGLALPANADTTDFTVRVANKAGIAQVGLTVVAIAIADGQPVDDVERVTGTAVSGKAGEYVLEGLDERPYTLLFTPKSTAAAASFIQMLGGGSTFAEAKLFTPSASLTSLDVTLAGNGSITGAVTGLGKPLANVNAVAYRFHEGAWEEFTHGLTNAKGVYSLTDISPGSYKVGFEPNPGVNFLPRFSGGSTTLEAAPTVYVGLGKAVTVSTALPVGGGISGRALFEDFDGYGYYLDTARPVAYRVLTRDGSVALTVDEDNPRFGTRSGLTGVWSVNGLATGDYVVMLVPSYADAPTGYVANNPYDYINGELGSATIIPVVQGRVKQSSPATIVDWFAQSYLTPVTVYTGLEGALVELEVGGTWSYQLTTGPSGIAYFDEDGGVQNGSYRVRVTKDYYETYLQTTYFSDYQSYVFVSLESSPLITFASAPVLSGTPALAGETFTVTAPVTGATSVRYAWLRDGMPIFGAASPSYTAGGGDVGHSISVRISAARANQPTKYAYAEAGTIAQGVAAVNTSAPWIAAPQAVRPGTSLVAHTGQWTVDGLHFQYGWYRDDVLLGRASTYLVTPQDVNSDLRLEVVATKPGRPDSAVASSVNVPVLPSAAPIAKVAPTVVAKKVGAATTFTVAPGTWPTGTTLSYEWRVNDQIRGTAKSLSLGAVDASANVVVEVRATRVGSDTATRTIVVRKGSAPLVAIAPVVNLAVDDWDKTIVEVFTPLSVVDGSWTYPAVAGTEGNSYQWRKAVGNKAPVAIKGATKNSYTPTIADLNTRIDVVVTHSSARFASSTVVVPTGVVRLNNSNNAAWPFEHSPALTGNPYVGSTLTFDPGVWVAQTTFTYRWESCTPEGTMDGDAECHVIPKATKATYVPTAADAGRLIQLQYTGSRPGYVPVTTWLHKQLITPTVLSNTTAVQISAGLIEGSAHVGTPLVATKGSWDVPGVILTHQWQVFHDGEWVNAPGISTGLKYTPTNETLQLAAGAIRVLETATFAGLDSVSVAAEAPLTIGTNGFLVAPRLTTTKTSWTVSPGTLRAPGSEPSWTWYRNGQPMAPAASYPIAGNAGASIIASVLVGAPGYDYFVHQIIVQKGATPPTNAGTVTGAPIAGSELTAPTGIFVYPDWLGTTPTLSYQWLQNGVAVKGATAARYTVRPADLGKKVTVRLTSRSNAFLDGVYTTPAVSVVAGTLTGESTLLQPEGPAAGKALGVELTGFPVGVAHAYQWQAAPTGSSAFVAVAGGTGSSYIPKLADVGRDLRLRVTSTRAGFTTRTTYTQTVTIVPGGVLDAVVTPVISGTLKVGGLLTVSAGTWNVPVTVGYQWFRNGVAIPGVTGATFTPLADSYNDDLWVVVTAKSLGYTTTTVRSNIVVPGPGTAPAIVGVNAPKITGTATACGTLTASTGIWTVDGLEFDVTWYIGGFEAGTGRTYSPGFGDVGLKATVVVSATRDGYAVGTATSVASAVITSPANCAP